MVTADVVLCALVASALVALVRPGPVVALVLAACSAGWLPANNRHLEGAVLVTFDSQHGMTVADLASIAGVVLAVVTIARWWWGARSPRRGAHYRRAATRPDQAGRASSAAVAVLMGQLAIVGAGVLLAWVHQPV